MAKFDMYCFHIELFKGAVPPDVFLVTPEGKVMVLRASPKVPPSAGVN